MKPLYTSVYVRFSFILLLFLIGCQNTPSPSVSLDAGEATLATDGILIDIGRGRPQAGEVAPNFSYVLPDGSKHTLAELQGKKVLLNFWATWCLPCLEEMPEFVEAEESSEGELVVLAVNRNELPEAIARFGKEHGFKLTLITNLSGDISDRYGVMNLPTSYFINSDGTISSFQIGGINSTLLAERLESLE